MTDTHAATELKLYIDNDGDLHRQQTSSILKNLATKRARGEYKHDLAVKAFGYLVEAGAKKYTKEFGTLQSQAPERRGHGVWHVMFSVPTRRAVAEAMAKDFEAEAKLGNYDSLLPKKYQKQETTAHARKKIAWKPPESLKVAWSPVNQAYFALWPGRGRIEDQQVLKTANAEDMHDWLRSTYGDAYGLAGRKSSRSHATISHAITSKDIREFRGFLRNATDRQIQGIYDKETRAGRDEYVELAIAEADRRGIELDNRNDHATITLGMHAHARRQHATITLGAHAHARSKSSAQLDREIANALSRRGGR